MTGEIANSAEVGNGVGTSGGYPATSGNPGGNEPGRRAAGTKVENGGRKGSDGDRVQGASPDETSGARLFRVTSMTKVADSCSDSGQ